MQKDVTTIYAVIKNRDMISFPLLAVRLAFGHAGFFDSASDK